MIKIQRRHSSQLPGNLLQNPRHSGPQCEADQVITQCPSMPGRLVRASDAKIRFQGGLTLLSAFLGRIAGLSRCCQSEMEMVAE